MMILLQLAQPLQSYEIGADRWNGGGSIGMLAILMLFLMALTLGVWFLARRRLPGRSANLQRLQILETRPLGGRQFLMVVAYGKEAFLLSVCPGRVEYLCPLNDVADIEPSEPRAAAPAGVGASFSKVLQAVQRGKQSEGTADE